MRACLVCNTQLPRRIHTRIRSSTLGVPRAFLVAHDSLSLRTDPLERRRTSRLSCASSAIVCCSCCGAAHGGLARLIVLPPLGHALGVPCAASRTRGVFIAPRRQCACGVTRTALQRTRALIVVYGYARHHLCALTAAHALVSLLIVGAHALVVRFVVTPSRTLPLGVSSRVSTASFLLTLLWALHASVTASGVNSEVACACEGARMSCKPVCVCVAVPYSHR